MYLLDTNVLSELMREAPSPAVLDWMNSQTPHKFFICAITRAAIELDIALLPTGKRKTNLATQAKAMFDEDFAGRCLPFDDSSASLYAALVAARTRQGLPISVEDAQIAAISLSNQKTLVTRNTVDFEKVQGLSLINPW